MHQIFTTSTSDLNFLMKFYGHDLYFIEIISTMFNEKIDPFNPLTKFPLTKLDRKNNRNNSNPTSRRL